MNTTTTTTQPTTVIPNGQNYDLPILGAELSILAMAIFGLLKGMIGSSRSAWEANQELIESLRVSLKEKEQTIEDKDNEILVLRSRLIKVQKSMLVYRQEEESVTSESN